MWWYCNCIVRLECSGSVFLVNKFELRRLVWLSAIERHTHTHQNYRPKSVFISNIERVERHAQHIHNLKWACNPINIQFQIAKHRPVIIELASVYKLDEKWNWRRRSNMSRHRAFTPWLVFGSPVVLHIHIYIHIYTFTYVCYYILGCGKFLMNIATRNSGDTMNWIEWECGDRSHATAQHAQLQTDESGDWGGHTNRAVSHVATAPPRTLCPARPWYNKWPKKRQRK